MASEIVFAKPQDVDVAVPAFPGTLSSIMGAYPLPWERAGNGPYFGSGGYLVGLAAERGTVYPDTGDRSVTKKWPALYIENGQASFGVTDEVRARKASCAMSAGPMLVEDGQLVDIMAYIRAGGYDPYDPTQRKAQRAIGITRDGMVVDGIWTDTNLYGVVSDMLEAGCVHVMKLDGGGSAGVISRSSDGKSRVVMGLTERKLPAVFVVNRVTHIEPKVEKTETLPKVNFTLDFDQNITENFKLREFRCHGEDPIYAVKCGCRGAVSLSPGFLELVSRLQALRTKVGKPINVTSGYRCATHDFRVGTSASKGRGPHTTGTAADIWWAGASVDQMANAAKSVGFTGIGRYYSQGFIHVDLRYPAVDFVG